MNAVNNYDSLKLENQLCFPIYLCSKEIVRKYNNILKKYDLTYTQYIVMMYLWEKSETNVKDLGSTLLLDSSTLTPLLKKLEIKGYIVRNRAENDERNLIIKLTSDGEKLKDKVINIPDKISKCDGVLEIEKVGKEYIIKISDESYIKDIFKVIAKYDNITKFSVEDPSLNEIFISIVGEAYE